MRTASIALLTLAACGRFGFGAVERTDDAAAGDGRASDAPPGDGPAVDAAHAACSGADIVCDPFDSALVGWVPFVNGGTVSIDNAVAHRGPSSLHVHSAAVPANTDGYFGVARMNVLPPAVGTLYLRAWVRISALPVNNMNLISFEQPPSPGNEDGVFVVPDAYSIYSQFQEKSLDTGVLPALDTWTCLLWTVVRGNPGSMQLAGDVGPISTSTQTDGSPAIEEIDLGIGFSANTTANQQPSLDVWIDDLIVRDAPITCAE